MILIERDKLIENLNNRGMSTRAFVIDENKVCEFMNRTFHNSTESIERYEKHKSDKKKTNADRIRAMSDEELAEFMDRLLLNGDMIAFDYPCLECTEKCECDDCVKEWLQSEVKE